MAMSSSCAPASTSSVVSKTFTAAVELPWGNPMTGPTRPPLPARATAAAGTSAGRTHTDAVR